MPPFFRRNCWALGALALGLVAIGLCVAATAIGYRTHQGIFGIGPNLDGNRIGLALRVVGGALGFGALALAIVGLIRHEHTRVWLAALGLAITALAWEYALLAVAVALIMLVVGALLSAT